MPPNVNTDFQIFAQFISTSQELEWSRPLHTFVPASYYIVMELLLGGALLDRILDSPNRQFSEHQALDIMKQAPPAKILNTKPQTTCRRSTS